MTLDKYEALLQQVDDALLRAVSANDAGIEANLLRLKAEILRDMRHV